MSPTLTGFRRDAARKGSDLTRQSTGKAEEFFEGHIFAEGNEMDFVVALRPCAVGCNHRRRVVNLGQSMRIAGVVDTDRTRDDVGIRVARDLRQGVTQLQVGGPERRRRFRPHDQPRTARLVSLRTHTQSLQGAQRLVKVFGRPVRAENRDVRLNQRSRLVGGQRLAASTACRRARRSRRTTMRSTAVCVLRKGPGKPRQRRC